MKMLIGYIASLLFGLGLTISGFTDPADQYFPKKTDFRKVCDAAPRKTIAKICYSPSIKHGQLLFPFSMAWNHCVKRGWCGGQDVRRTLRKIAAWEKWLLSDDSATGEDDGTLVLGTNKRKTGRDGRTVIGGSATGTWLSERGQLHRHDLPDWHPSGRPA